MSTELTIAAKVDASLTASVAKNVGKTVKLMCNKCEQALVLDDEASQVRNNFLIPLLSKAADFSERSLSEVVVQRGRNGRNVASRRNINFILILRYPIIIL